jgi:large subunit ribosomal protein L9
MLAEKIAHLTVAIKRKLHDDGKLYGSVSQNEIAEALAAQGVHIAKNQVQIDKSIKEKGTYQVTIKLTSRLQPMLKVQVVSE